MGLKTICGILIALLLVASSYAASGTGIKHPPLQVNDNGTISYGFFYLLTITNGGSLTNPNDGTLALNCGGSVATRFLLLEDSAVFLFENSAKLILE